MTGESLFADPVAARIWAQYFRRMNRLLRPLDAEQAGELKLEIQGHLLESFRSDSAASEAERLLNAIDRLGEPEAFIGPMRADRLLDKASRSFRPLDVMKGLVYHLAGGTKKAVLGALYVLGYLLAVGFGLIAVLKVFVPRHVGLFLFGDGDVIFGFAVDVTRSHREVLGLWIIPLGAIAAFGLYLGLTRLLRLLRNRP